MMIHYLVGGLEHFLFFHILGIIIPTDELIFFRGVGIPLTRNIMINDGNPYQPVSLDYANWVSNTAKI
jgi:hypothetical protein